MRFFRVIKCFLFKVGKIFKDDPVADLGEGQGGAPPLARKVARSGPLWAL